MINDENDSINSLSMSGDEVDEKKERKTDLHKYNQVKDELIEQLSQQMIKEQVTNTEQTMPNNNNEHANKLNSSETELLTDSGLGDSQANLSSVTQLANLATSTHLPNTQQAVISAVATAASAALTSSVLGSTNPSRSNQSKSNPLHKQLTKLDSFPLTRKSNYTCQRFTNHTSRFC